jgi:hypothetical protein
VESLLVRATIFAAEVVPTATEPKAKVVGLKVYGNSPVPLSATVCGESGALSMMASEPVRAPAIDGVKVTVTLHTPRALIVEPQLLLATAKFPVAVIELRLTSDGPLFVILMDFEALVVFATCGLKTRLGGEGVTVGALATVNGRNPNAAQLAPLGKFST